MSDVTEETKREVLKLAVQLAQTYVKSYDITPHFREAEWLGLDNPEGPHSLQDIVRCIYDQLLGVITR